MSKTDQVLSAFKEIARKNPYYEVTFKLYIHAGEITGADQIGDGRIKIRTTKETKKDEDE